MEYFDVLFGQTNLNAQEALQILEGSSWETIFLGMLVWGRFFVDE